MLGTARTGSKVNGSVQAVATLFSSINQQRFDCPIRAKYYIVCGLTSHKYIAVLKAHTNIFCRCPPAPCKEHATDWPGTGWDSRERCKHSGSCISTIDFNVRCELSDGKLIKIISKIFWRWRKRLRALQSAKWFMLHFSKNIFHWNNFSPCTADMICLPT